jgi:membrane-associated phospholipid phosphatase
VSIGRQQRSTVKNPQRPPVSLQLPFGSWLWVPVALVLFALTLTLGFVVKSFGPVAPGLALDLELAGARSPVLTALALAVHYALGPPGAIAILVVICAWLFWVRTAPVASLAFGSITAIGWLSSEIGKLTVLRPRPWGDTLNAVISETRPDSFPSGHTAFAAALAWAVVLVLSRPGRARWITIAAGVVFALAVGFSRVYLGVHYPGDILGSILISAAGIILWLPVWNNLIEPRLRRSGLVNRPLHTSAESESESASAS